MLIMVILVCIIYLLAGCGGGADGSKAETKVVIKTEALTIPETTSVVMYCDSMGLPGKSGLTWLDMFGDIAQVETSSYCVGGIKIRDYPIDEKIKALGTHHKYAIIALGFNDHGLDIIETLNLYEDFINKVEIAGMEPVCFTYPNTSALSEHRSLLNDGIESICVGLKIIHSAPQIIDYVHFTDEGRMNTAIDAARALYP